jgi:hypothetical protein
MCHATTMTSATQQATDMCQNGLARARFSMDVLAIDAHEKCIT